MLKIIFSIGLDKFARETYYEEYKSLNNENYEFILFDHREPLGGRIIWDARTLDRLFCNQDKKLFQTYNQLSELINKTKADVLIVGADNVYHPEFIKDLDVYTVLRCTDDPGASYRRTVPYIWAFDHVTCVNVIYHENIPVKMTGKLREWGAKRATWFPMGIREFYYDPSLTEASILNQGRTADVIYVGAPARSKIPKLLELKKAMGRKLTLYGNWSWKAWGYTLYYYKRWLWPQTLPQSMFVPVYQKAKIGINMHLSGELGNGRLYQLPANGVMQICDCADVLGEVFEPGKEIVGYRSIDEAIELIRYYLEHDEERKQIAAAGFRRAMKDYKYSTCLYRVLDEVKQGMWEKGIKHLKDGAPLQA